MDLQEKIWKALSASDDACIPDFVFFAKEAGVTREDAASLMTSLIGREMILSESLIVKRYELSKDAKSWLVDGTPEAKLWSKINAAGDAGVVPTAADRAGQGPLSRAKLLRIEAHLEPAADPTAKPKKITTLFPAEGAVFSDPLGEFLASIGDRALTAADMKAWRARKAVMEVKEKTFRLTRGSRFASWHSSAPSNFSRDMLASYTTALANGDELPSLELLDYKWEANGKPPARGYMHPLMSMRREVKEIFQEMGFEEMPTRRWVESSFWNFDALFQGQQHPARDSHDTFFCADAAATPETVPREYRDRVQATHEHGGDTGSLGYSCPWSVEESEQNILRTHTTAVSARVLYGIAQEWRAACAEAEAAGQPLPPVPTRRLFSVDRVFRNEKLDATHLAEFHQIEGLILAPNLTLGHLMHTIREFFAKFGMTDISFKPTYNPYTEPSMEIFAYHPVLKRSIEVGNSGMFRPEMLRPMGFPEEVTVIAWGFGLERPTMIKHDIPHIRKLFGHGVALGESIRRVPMPMLQTEEPDEE